MKGKLAELAPGMAQFRFLVPSSLYMDGQLSFADMGAAVPIPGVGLLCIDLVRLRGFQQCRCSRRRAWRTAVICTAGGPPTKTILFSDEFALRIRSSPADSWVFPIKCPRANGPDPRPCRISCIEMLRMTDDAGVPGVGVEAGQGGWQTIYVGTKWCKPPVALFSSLASGTIDAMRQRVVIIGAGRGGPDSTMGTCRGGPARRDVLEGDARRRRAVANRSNTKGIPHRHRWPPLLLTSRTLGGGEDL